MDNDLRQLGEELVTTAARIVRWVPTDGFTLSLAAARLLARMLDNGPTRISDLATQERCSQPTITNHVKRLETAGLVDRAVDPHDARAWMIDLTPAGQQRLAEHPQPPSAPTSSPIWRGCPSAITRRCGRDRGHAADDCGG